ncbi:MAG: ABC transporter permease [Bacilli bacterium]
MMEYPIAKVEEYGYKDYSKWKKIFKIFKLVVVILIIFALYMPIGLIAIQSVNSSTILNEFNTFTLSWYTKIFDHPTLAPAIKNTFIVSFGATVLSTILGTFVAVGINSLETKKRQRLLLLNNIPLLNADIVTGISLMLVFSIFTKTIPNLLGIQDLVLFGLPTLILAHLFFTFPYVILSVLPKLREIDPNLMDAALDLGVRPYRALIKVIVPAIKAGIFSGMLLAFTMSIDDFVVSYFTTGNGFDNLSIWIYASIGRRSLTPAVYAFSTLLTLFTLGILLILNFIDRKKGKNKNEKN